MMGRRDYCSSCGKPVTRGYASLPEIICRDCPARSATTPPPCALHQVRQADPNAPPVIPA